MKMKIAGVVVLALLVAGCGEDKPPCPEVKKQGALQFPTIAYAKFSSSRSYSRPSSSFKSSPPSSSSKSSPPSSAPPSSNFKSTAPSQSAPAFKNTAPSESKPAAPSVATPYVPPVTRPAPTPVKPRTEERRDTYVPSYYDRDRYNNSRPTVIQQQPSFWSNPFLWFWIGTTMNSSNSHAAPASNPVPATGTPSTTTNTDCD